TETNAWATSSSPSDAASFASGAAVRSGRKIPYSTSNPTASRKTAVTISAGAVDRYGSCTSPNPGTVDHGAVPAISDPAPRPRIAWRTTCSQSIPPPYRRPKGGAAVEGGPADRREDVVLAPELEGARRPEEAGDALELAGALVLEELRLVVARGRLG